MILVDLAADACAEVAAGIQSTGGAAWAFALDITDAAACQALAGKIAAEIGAIDILVNNAGILIREGVDSAQAHENMRRTFDVNVMGGFNVLHACLPALRQTRGNIINIASAAALIAQRNCLGYSGSKGAVKMMTQAMAADLARDGIRVNAIAPGVIETPMTAATRSDPVRLQAFMQRTPLGRLGLPEEIAQPAVFLASDMASYITGVTLPVDGGMTAT